jgi:hypothetical protein
MYPCAINSEQKNTISKKMVKQMILASGNRKHFGALEYQYNIGKRRSSNKLQSDLF